MPSTPPADPYAAYFGDFAPVHHEGSGDSVITLPAGADAGLVSADYDGGRNFILKTLDADNEYSDLLVNEIGGYSGVTAYGVTDYGSDHAALQITSSGPWSITISPVAAAPKLESETRGTGDAVHHYDGDSAMLAMTHSGESNFIVRQSLGDRRSLLVNEIGAYDGMVPLRTGPSVLVIEADGGWTAAVS